jgi:hypothetical protein
MCVLTCLLIFELRRAPGKASDFEDDEYVVFASNQQYISHLVEFALKQGTIDPSALRSLVLYCYACDCKREPNCCAHCCVHR